ncbi:C40 family peptidase [Ideonella sp. 4Y11]|uniref:C40 family peptidase n=1 Tax=Ideonella aquatica TaxID=2824119 RepID=A0A940YJ09_9BURK|nr:C40 family peptidase [Ideonella aquatica]MBQ0958744.1 C40 family peptidase [Ideonella aquatica]
MDVIPRERRRGPCLLSGTALALALLCGSAWASPDGASPKSGDPVMRLLEERGVLSAAGTDSAPTLLSQVRDKASDLVLTAMNFIGVRYRRGGGTEDQGFDCSGFTRYVFEHSVGLVLPRRAAEQAASPGLVAIPMEDLKPGDLVFFNTMRRAFSHVGIYVGDGKFIHSPRTGEQVRVEDMRIAYWAQRFNGARRAPQTTEPLRPAQ